MKMSNVVFLALFLAAFTTAINGEVYKVGGSSGWTHIGHVDYKTWAATKNFRVGDTIVFDYNKDFQNVARVSYTDFVTCNGTAPYTTLTSGNDVFQINFPGHYFFICTVPGHCQAGQKVDIRVPVAGRHPTFPASHPPIHPLPFPYPQPFVPSVSPVKQPKSQSPLPAPSQSPPPTTTHSTSQVPPQSPATHSPSQAPRKSSNVAPTRSPSQAPPLSPPSAQTPPKSAHPAPTQSPSQAPSVAEESPSSTPSVAEDSPSSTTGISSPAMAPAPHKNTGSQSVSNVKLWAPLVAVMVYLIGFSF